MSVVSPLKDTQTFGATHTHTTFRIHKSMYVENLLHEECGQQSLSVLPHFLSHTNHHSHIIIVTTFSLSSL